MSRDPNTPVNLTTVTPVGPQVRASGVDRVERLRYWHRDYNNPNGVGGGVDNILREDGFNMLREDGYVILRET